MAYDMIVTAFANGDRKALNSLLRSDVFEGFDRRSTSAKRAAMC